MSMYPRRAEPPKEVTLRARIVLEDELAHYFYLSVSRFKAGAARALELAKRGVTSATTLYRDAYRVIENKRYADVAVLLVREIVESARVLGVELGKVVLKDWWMLQSRGSPRPEDKGNRNIRLVATDKAKIVLSAEFDLGSFGIYRCCFLFDIAHRFALCLLAFKLGDLFGHLCHLRLECLEFGTCVCCSGCRECCYCQSRE